MKRIEVTVSTKGETRIEAFGFDGSSCQIATSKLEQALGVNRSQNFKPEFYETQSHETRTEEKQ